MKRRLRYVLLVALVWLFPAMAMCGNVQLNAKLDSALLLMGKTTAMHIEIVQDKNVKGYFVEEHADTLNAFVEIAGRPKDDTVDLGNNRIQIKKDLILQSFDSGMYVLPPLRYVVGNDTVKSNQLTLKVLPVKVGNLKDIHDYKPVQEVPFKLFDLVPTFITDYWWVYLIVVVLVLAGLYAYFKWYRKGINPLKHEKKRLPPYEEAVLGLKELKGRNLWQNGQEKEYFTQLTDILRVYIDRRFKVNAVEMTSSQIIAVLKKNEETKAVNEQLKSILEMADFVKFANMKPLADDNEAAYNKAVHFVEETKPAPEPEPEADKAGGKEEVKK